MCLPFLTGISYQIWSRFFEDVKLFQTGKGVTVIVAFLLFTFSSLVSLCQLKQSLNSYNINVYFSKTLNIYNFIRFVVFFSCLIFFCFVSLCFPIFFLMFSVVCRGCVAIPFSATEISFVTSLFRGLRQRTKNSTNSTNDRRLAPRKIPIRPPILPTDIQIYTYPSIAICKHGTFI